MRVYQSEDGDWIATNDAGYKARGATEAAVVAQFRAAYPDAAQASDAADARAAAEREARRKGPRRDA